MVLPWLKSKDFFMEKFNSVKTNNMEGWIKLHRKLLESPVFQNEKLYKIFSWCLLKASHTEHTELIGLQKVSLSPGQFVYGRHMAAKELKIKESTLYKYMMWLKNEEILNIQSNNKFSVVTVVNWDLYQSDEPKSNSKVTTKEQQRNSKVTTKEQQRNTNNNVKNVKNVKNEKNNPNISLSKENNSLSKDIFVPSRDSEIDEFDTLNSIKPKMARTKGKALFDVPVQKKEKVSQDKYLALATKLSEIIQTKKNIKHTKSQIQAWAKQFARLERENKVQYERQMAAMRWYEEHIGEPYVPVIESGSSFREKFINLEAAITRSENSYTQKTKNNSGIAYFDPEYNDILMRKAKKIKVTVL